MLTFLSSHSHLSCFLTCSTRVWYPDVHSKQHPRTVDTAVFPDTQQSSSVMKRQPRTRHRHRLPQIIHIFHLVSFANLLESTGQKIPPRHILGSTLICSPGRWPKVADLKQDKDVQSNPCHRDRFFINIRLTDTPPH